MKLLAIDTATEACSVALLGDHGVLERYEVIGRGHAERLLPMVAEVLAEAGWSLRALDGIAVGRGPGAFTGVRIAIATAQGLAYGAGLPVVPVSDLAAVGYAALLRAREAWPEDPPTSALACLDARMGEVYCAEVTTDATLGVTLGTERVLAPGALVAGPEAFGRTWVGAGHGFGSYRALAASWGCPFKCVWPELLPSASSIVQLGAMRLAAGFGLAASAVEPVYLRNNVANQSSPRVPA